MMNNKTKPVTYKIRGSVKIMQFIYEYGEEDPVEILRLELHQLSEKEFGYLQGSVEQSSEGLEEYIDASFEDIPGVIGAVSEEAKKEKLIKGIVQKIVVSVDEQGSLATVVCQRELTDEQQNILLRYVRGQYSDGWGSGFAQEPFYEEDRVLVASFQRDVKIEE